MAAHSKMPRLFGVRREAERHAALDLWGTGLPNRLGPILPRPTGKGTRPALRTDDPKRRRRCAMSTLRSRAAAEDGARTSWTRWAARSRLSPAGRASSAEQPLEETVGGFVAAQDLGVADGDVHGQEDEHDPIHPGVRPSENQLPVALVEVEHENGLQHEPAQGKQARPLGHGYRVEAEPFEGVIFEARPAESQQRKKRHQQ